MAAASTQPTPVASLLHDLQQKDGGSVCVEDISVVVEGIMESLRRDLSTADRKVFVEIEGLANFIASTKRDIAALRPDEVKDDFLPAATDELDAIVAATADATHKIMDSAEAVEGVAATADKETAVILTDAANQIYEACSFQDITGQRITKVVNALKEIEARVDSLIAAFGDEIAEIKAQEAANPKKTDAVDGNNSDATLLNGPQLEGEGNSQDEIDKLFD